MTTRQKEMICIYEKLYLSMEDDVDITRFPIPFCSVCLSRITGTLRTCVSNDIINEEATPGFDTEWWFVLNECRRRIELKTESSSIAYENY